MRATPGCSVRAAARRASVQPLAATKPGALGGSGRRPEAQPLAPSHRRYQEVERQAVRGPHSGQRRPDGFSVSGQGAGTAAPVPGQPGYDRRTYNRDRDLPHQSGERPNGLGRGAGTSVGGRVAHEVGPRSTVRKDAWSGTSRAAGHPRTAANLGTHNTSSTDDRNVTSAGPSRSAGRGRDRSASPGGEGRGGVSGGAGTSYAQRVARLRKPALTAADKTALEPEERQRIAEQLRVPLPRDPGAPPLRVFGYGIDDVRLYKAARGAGLVGRLQVVASPGQADAVLSVPIKRTGKALVLADAVRAARNAGVPFVELPTLSPERLAEAWESLTGRPAPGLRRLRWQHQQREQRQRDAMAGVEYLPPLHDPECEGSARALSLLTGGQPLHVYIAGQLPDLPPSELLRELDGVDVWDERQELLPANPQEREAVRQRPLARPHMPGSRMKRLRLAERQRRLAAEASGAVQW